MDTRTKNIFKASILTASIMQMSAGGIAPVLSAISRSFPDASDTTIQFLMALPNIFSLIFNFLSAVLSEKISRRFLLVFGLSLNVLAGLCAWMFHGSLPLLFLWGSLIGVSVGIVSPLVLGLVTANFDGNEKQTMLGWQNSAANAGAMVMTLCAGFLARLGWHFGYLIYFLAIPGILCVLFGIPKEFTGPAKSADNTQEDRPAFRLAILFEIILVFFYVLMYGTVTANIAMLVTEKQLGDSGLSGILTTILYGSGIICGLLFGKISQLLKGRTKALGTVLFAVGALIIGKAGSTVLLMLGCFVAGVSITLVIPGCMGAASRLPGWETINSAILLSCSYTAALLSPLMTRLTNLITSSDQVEPRLYIAACGAVLLTIYVVVQHFSSARKE